jgi:hypothetical protein
MIAPILEEIQQYNQSDRKRALRSEVDRLGTCPRCGRKPGRFTYHDQRRRTFLVIVGRLIRKVLSYLTRWKCSRCAKAFTFYPRFALRYKRYVRDAVVERSHRYLEEDPLTYRRAVLDDELPIFYDSEVPGKIDERGLAPSTLHRWITTLGELRPILREALSLIRSKAPHSNFLRLPPFIAPGKYRSMERKEILQDGLSLLRAEPVYRILFATSILPRLATRMAWARERISSKSDATGGEHEDQR